MFNEALRGRAIFHTELLSISPSLVSSPPQGVECKESQTGADAYLRNQTGAHVPFKKRKGYSKMTGKRRHIPTDIKPQCVPAGQLQPELHHAGVRKLSAHSQGWLRVVPNHRAPRAALSLVQSLSLSTEEGQVPFGASVGIVSFFTTLVAGNLLQRPRSPVACTAVLTLHDPDDLWGSLLCWRLCLLW